MSNNDKTFADTLLMEFSLVLAPLSQVDSPGSVFGLMRDLGWKLPASDLFENGFPNIIGEVETLINNLYEIADAVDSEDYLELIQTVMESVEAVIKIVTEADGLRREIETELNAFQSFINDSGIATEEFPKRLLDYLISIYLQSRRPRIYGIVHLLGILENEERTAAHSWEPVPIDSTYTIRKIYWDRIPKIFTDPLSLASDVYDWDANKEFKADRFLSRLNVLLRGFLIPAGLYEQDQSIHGHINKDSSESRELRIPFYQAGNWPDTYLETGISIAPLDAVTGPPIKPKGLAILPYLLGIANFAEDISENWQLTIKGSLNLNSGLGLLLRPPHDMQVDTSLFISPQSAVAGRIEIGIKRKQATNGHYLIFGSEKSSRLGFEQAGISLLAANEGGDQELAIELNVDGLTLVIDTANSDGFIQKILSSIKIETVVDLTMGLSNKDGFYFRGSGALEIEIPVHESLGPIKLEKVFIGIGIDANITAILAVSFGVELGPIAGSVEKIGLTIPIGFAADNKGNLGPLDVKPPNYLPPTGAGLSVDAEGVIFGGGFLDFDTQNERYSGILALNLGEYAITAIGLITTKMPDGSKDFSMLINIGVIFDPPIELSMGFTLSGVGGLIGINRAMVIEELQKGVRKGTLDSILFPDPSTVIANAQKIISDMRTVFPPASGKFVIGPMVKIGYGSPNVIQADIGIFLVLPDLSEMALLGKLKATFPTPEEVIVKINMHLLGTLSLEKKEFTFQSSIYDSEILKFALYGDTAALLRWSEPPEFTMAMGGFHPKFTPPPPEIIFGGLRRLTLNVNWGTEIFLMCQSYMALTPNSLQFGASVQLIVNVGELHADGSFSFDALFYFSPFSFEISADASVNVTIAGASLVDADIDLFLSGPTPWNARGSATVRLLFIDVTDDFNITWGQPGVPVTPAVDPLEALVTALNDNHNWNARLPHTRSMVETLQPMEADGAGALVVHPAGSLEVRQSVLPLGLQLKKFGNSPITGHDQFEIKRISIGSKEENPKYQVKEYLNRGAYEKLSKHEKLSKPSFEKMTVGVSFSSDPIVFGGDESKWGGVSHDYESVYLTREELSKTTETNGGLDPDDARLLVAGSSASRSKQLTGGDRKFVTANQQPLTKVNQLSYTIVKLSDFSRADDIEHQIGDDRSLWHVEQVLETYIEENLEDPNEYIVVAEYELEKEAV